MKRDRREPKSGTRKVGEDRQRKRLTISLSQKSVEAWKEIREATDADSNSEVFRNSLRLYLSLLRAHQDGKKMLIRDDKTGKTEAVDLFFPVAS